MVRVDLGGHWSWLCWPASETETEDRELEYTNSWHAAHNVSIMSASCQHPQHLHQGPCALLQKHRLTCAGQQLKGIKGRD